jgi:hypothetical protein
MTFELIICYPRLLQFSKCLLYDSGIQIDLDKIRFKADAIPLQMSSNNLSNRHRNHRLFDPKHQNHPKKKRDHRNLRYITRRLIRESKNRL